MTTSIIEAEAFVPAPVETVYRYITDLSNLPHWVGPVKSVNATPGPAQVGAEVAVSAYLIGKSVDTTLQVTNVRDNESFGYRFPLDTYGDGFDFVFESVSENQTKVLMAYRMSDRNIFNEKREEITQNLQTSLDTLRQNIVA